MKGSEIIKILEKNRLYDDRSDIEISSNLLNVFLKTYKHNETNFNFLPNSITRDNNGYIDLSRIPFISSNNKEEGHTNKFWILLNNGSRILLKETKNIKSAELELLFDELANELNIPVASYDIGKISNTLYLISSSFLQSNEFLFDKYQFKKHKIKNEKIELYEIKKLLEKIDNLSLRNHLYKTLFIDRFTDNFDRIPNNLKIIMPSKNTRICPLYDNDKCCDKDFEKKKLYMVFSNEGKYDSENIFKFLLDNKEFSEYINNTKRNVNIDKLCTNIYNNKNILISSESINDFSNTINENEYHLKETIKILNKRF